MRRGDFRELTRAERIVADRLRRLAFHQEHVLVGRRVKHHLRAVPSEDRLHPRPFEDIGHQRRDRAAEPFLIELLLDQKQRRLALFHQQQALRVERRDLPAELAADAAARARHQHHLTRECLPDARGIDLHRRPAQEVLHLDRPHATGLNPPRRQLLQRGHDLHFQAMGRRRRQHFAEAPRGSRGHRDHRLVQSFRQPLLRQQLRPARHRHAVHLLAVLGLVVIEEQHRFEPPRRVAQEFIREPRPDIPRPDDRDALQRPSRRPPRATQALPVQPRRQATAAEDAKRQHEIHQQHPARRPEFTPAQRPRQQQHPARHRHRPKKPVQIRQAEIRHQRAELAEQRQRPELQPDHPRQQPHPLDLLLRRQKEVEPHLIGRVKTRPDDARVNARQSQRPPMLRTIGRNLGLDTESGHKPKLGDNRLKWEEKVPFRSEVATSG